MRNASLARLVLILFGVLALIMVFASPAAADEQPSSDFTAMVTDFAAQAMESASYTPCQDAPDVPLPTLPVVQDLYYAAFEVGFGIGYPLSAGDYAHPVRPFEQSLLQFVPSPERVVPDGWLSPCEAFHAGNIRGLCFGSHVEQLSYELLLAMSGNLPCPTGANVTAPPITLEGGYVADPSISRGIGLHQMQGWWGSDQWPCLEQLWTEESGWTVVKWNYGGSGAYGIPQALPGYKMSVIGADWETSARTQIAWGLSYIADRHGNPCNALAHKHAYGWY